MPVVVSLTEFMLRRWCVECDRIYDDKVSTENMKEPIEFGCECGHEFFRVWLERIVEIVK